MTSNFPIAFKEIRFYFYFRALTLIAIGGHVVAQNLQRGSCIDKQGVDSLNIDEFLGDWYEYGRTSNLIEEFGKCTAFRFHQPVKAEWPVSRLMVVDFFNIKTNNTNNLEIDAATGKGKSWDGYDITFIKVDYDDYAVLYGCRKPFILPKQEVIWMLTRKRMPETQTIINAYNAISDFGLPLNGITQTDQKNCPDLSEFD